MGGSITQIPGTPFQYIPDFCVRALTDLQFVKVTLRFRYIIGEKKHILQVEILEDNQQNTPRVSAVEEVALQKNVSDSCLAD